MTLALALGIALSFADSLETYYAQKDVGGIQRICEEVQSVEAELLCTYRLYPLTKEDELLLDLPVELQEGTARALALLSGLWGYRATQAPWFRAIQYGRQAGVLLDQARKIDRDDPFVLLVQGQSLLFRPRIAGGNPRAALAYFEELEGVIEEVPGCGISMMEAAVWAWYALAVLEESEAADARRTLLAQNPPPLYREFLNSDPS